MPKAKKLPSGSWRCQVSAGTDPDGKRVRESFTAGTKREAELMAAEFLARKRSGKTHMTVQAAIEQYLSSREHILSPSTLRGYLSLAKTAYGSINTLQLEDVTSATVQVWLNTFSIDHAPKTSKNAVSLLTAAITMYLPDKKISITLPQKKKKVLYIPTDADVQALLDYCAGTELEVTILLAAFGPLRRGEICALTGADINRKENTVTVSKNMVYTKDATWTVKQPKTYAGYRTVTFPSEIIRKIPKVAKNQHLIQSNPDQLYRHFKAAVKNCGLHDMRLHDMRHYAASMFHYLGVSDQRIMERGGWDSDYVMKRIYRGSTSDIQRKEDDKIFSHIKEIS